MYIFLKNIRERFSNKGKEGILFILLSFGIFVACQGALEDTNPFSPSTTAIRVVPNTVALTQGGTITFTTLGATAPFSWTSSNLVVGTIVADTGVFTAGTTSGTSTVTLVDAVGDTATSTVTVSGLPLTFDVTGITQDTVDATDVITVTANSSGGGFTATIANNNTGSTYALSPTFATTTGTTFTITTPATQPTLAEGNQTFTISVTDTGNGNTGTVTYVFQAALV
jgi:hypothetical protein